MAGSPQSTLCRSLDSSGSQGGSNGPSQVSSPPSTPLNQQDDAWDLLCAAAGQVVRMKMNEGEKYQGRGLLGPPKKPVAVPVPVPAPAVVPKQGTQMKVADVSAYPLQRCWSDNGRDASALAMRFELLKQQKQQKQQESNWGKQQQQQQLQAAKIAQAQQMQSLVRCRRGEPEVRPPPGAASIFLASSSERFCQHCIESGSSPEPICQRQNERGFSRKFWFSTGVLRHRRLPA